MAATTVNGATTLNAAVIQNGAVIPNGAVNVGIGLRQPHLAEVLATRPALGFVEVHSENYFADGGAALAGLFEARALYPVSLHGVGLALGSAAGLDDWHLDRLARLVGRIEPVRVSDHACYARAAAAAGGVVHANDLLPIAFTEATLQTMAAQVGRVQDRLGRPILIENLAASLSFADSAMSEPAFLARLCRQSGCGLLLDVNNLMVNALNELDSADGGEALVACVAWLEALPLGIVGEIHLAGYRETAAFGVVDDHGSRVRPEVWQLYRHALRRFGMVPTLIEWDTDLPPLEVLLGEAGTAAAVQAQVLAGLE